MTTNEEIRTCGAEQSAREAIDRVYDSARMSVARLIAANNEALERAEELLAHDPDFPRRP